LRHSTANGIIAQQSVPKLLRKGGDMNELKKPKLIVTVTLANGETVSHIYNLPTPVEDAIKFWDKKWREIFSSKSTLLFISDTERTSEQPVFTLYNNDFVQSVNIHFLNAEKYEELIRHAAKDKLGFLKD